MLVYATSTVSNPDQFEEFSMSLSRRRVLRQASEIMLNDFHLRTSVTTDIISFLPAAMKAPNQIKALTTAADPFEKGIVATEGPMPEERGVAVLGVMTKATLKCRFTVLFICSICKEHHRLSYYLTLNTKS